MSDVIRRLSSRKFLLSVSAAAAAVSAKEYVSATVIIVAYVLGEAAVDAADRRNNPGDAMPAGGDIADLTAVIEDLASKVAARPDDREVLGLVVEALAKQKADTP